MEVKISTDRGPTRTEDLETSFWYGLRARNCLTKLAQSGF